MISAKEAVELTIGYTKEELAETEKYIEEQIKEAAKENSRYVNVIFDNTYKMEHMISNIISNLVNLGYTTNERIYEVEGRKVSSAIELSIKW